MFDWLLAMIILEGDKPLSARITDKDLEGLSEDAKRQLREQGIELPGEEPEFEYDFGNNGPERFVQAKLPIEDKGDNMSLLIFGWCLLALGYGVSFIGSLVLGLGDIVVEIGKACTFKARNR